MQATTLDSLQGFWQSKEDNKFVIQIKGLHKISIYANREIDDEGFNLDDSCLKEVNKNNELKSNGNFLIGLDSNRASCFEIVSLLEKHLTLRGETSGKFLIFKRIKKIKPVIE